MPYHYATGDGRAFVFHVEPGTPLIQAIVELSVDNIILAEGETEKADPAELADALCEALDAPALPEVDDGRWVITESGGLQYFGDFANRRRYAYFDTSDDVLTPDDYRQIAAKALQLAAKIEMGEK